jgi:hypothetical protein
VPALLDYVQGQRTTHRPLDPLEALEEEISVLTMELEPLLDAFRRLRRTSSISTFTHEVYQSGEAFIREIAKGEANRIGADTGEGLMADAQREVSELLDAKSVAVDRLGDLVYLRREHERRATGP